MTKTLKSWDFIERFSLIYALVYTRKFRYPCRCVKRGNRRWPVSSWPQFHLALGRTIPSRDNHEQIDEWITRVCNRRAIGRLELYSPLGTLPFCEFSVGHGRHTLRPIFRSAHRQVASHRPKSNDMLVVSSIHRACLKRLQSNLKQTGGVALLSQPKWKIGEEAASEGWTNASRDLSLGAYSGMVGYCPNTGIVWFYRSSQHQLALPIYVLECLADLGRIYLNSGELQGERYLAHLDNQSALGSLRSTRRVKDPNLNFLAILRNRALDLNVSWHKKNSLSLRRTIWQILCLGVCSASSWKGRKKKAPQNFVGWMSGVLRFRSTFGI